MLAKEAILLINPETELKNLNCQKFEGQGEVATVIEDLETITFSLGLNDSAIRARFTDKYESPDGKRSSIIAVFSGEELNHENGLVINLNSIRKDMIKVVFGHGLNRASESIIPKPPKKPQGLLKRHNSE